MSEFPAESGLQPVPLKRKTRGCGREKSRAPAKQMSPGKTTPAEQTGMTTLLTLCPYKATDVPTASHPNFSAQAHKTSLGGVGVPQIITTNNSKNGHGMQPEEYFGTVLLGEGVFRMT